MQLYRLLILGFSSFSKESEYLMSIRKGSFNRLYAKFKVVWINHVKLLTFKFEFFYQLNCRNHVWEHWLSSSLVSPQWSIEKPSLLKHGNEPWIRNKAGRL